MPNQKYPFDGDIYLEQEYLRLRNVYGVMEVIETGTYHGVTTEWLARNFKNVQTIEDDIQYAEIASERLKECKNVRRWLGSSSELLRLALNESVCELTHLIVFLDAHWYDNPVMDELKQIKQSQKRPILIIHDFKNPNYPEYGYDQYPLQGNSL